MYNNRSLKILFIANGIFVFAGKLLGPLYAVFAENFDTNVLSISFAWFVYMFSSTLFSVVVLYFGDRIKEKEYMLILGFLLRALSSMLYIFIGSFFMFIIVQIILGIGDAFGSPAFDSIFAEHLDRGREIYNYSSWKVIQNFLLAVASLIGGIVVYYINFDFLFFIMACLALLSAVIVYLQPRKLL